MLNIARSCLGICVVLACSMWHAGGSVFAVAAAERVNDIESIVAQINGVKSESTRAELARKLANSVRTTTDQDQIANVQTDDIASLLRDRNDAVRYWAALTLGQLGARATTEVPALETALREAEARDKPSIVGPELSSVDAIRAALAKITGRPYPLRQ